MHVEKGLSLGYFQDIFLNVIFSCTLCQPLVCSFHIVLPVSLFLVDTSFLTYLVSPLRTGLCPYHNRMPSPCNLLLAVWYITCCTISTVGKHFLPLVLHGAVSTPSWSTLQSPPCSRGTGTQAQATSLWSASWTCTCQVALPSWLRITSTYDWRP